MKNLFSLTTNSIMQKIHAIPFRNKNGKDKTIEGLWSDFKNKSILHITDSDEKLLSEADSIERIAEICIKICSFLFHSPYGTFSSASKTINDVSKYDIFEQTFTISENSIQEDDIFFDEDKQFLIYSFIYNQSCNQEIANFPLKNISKSIRNSKKSYIISNKLSSIKNNDKKFRRYSLNITPQQNDFTFKHLSLLPFDFPDSVNQHTTPCCTDMYLDYLLNYSTEKESYTVSTYYDILLLLGLIQSENPSKNPFLCDIDEKGVQMTKCNMEEFVKGFNPNIIFPFSSFHELTQPALSKTMKMIASWRKKRCESNTAEKILKSNISFFNQVESYLIERLTNHYFINRIANLYMKFPTISQFQCIYNLSAYPLLSYRIHIIDKIERHWEYVHNNEIDSEEKIKEKWGQNSYKLCALITHHLFFAFPQLDLLFNLSLLRKGFYFREIDLEKYQNHKAETKHRSASSMIAPKISRPFDIRKDDYHSIIDKVFDQFGNYAILGDVIEKQNLNVLDEESINMLRYYLNSIICYQLNHYLGIIYSSNRFIHTIPKPYSFD